MSPWRGIPWRQDPASTPCVIWWGTGWALHRLLLKYGTAGYKARPCSFVLKAKQTLTWGTIAAASRLRSLKFKKKRIPLKPVVERAFLKCFCGWCGLQKHIPGHTWMWGITRKFWVFHQPGQKLGGWRTPAASQQPGWRRKEYPGGIAAAIPRVHCTENKVAVTRKSEVRVRVQSSIGIKVLQSGKRGVE